MTTTMQGNFSDQLDAACEVISASRDVAERQARLAPEVLEAGGRSGLWALCAPREVGGHELALPELAAALARLGEADPTVAWHAANSGLTGFMAAQLPEAERDVVFASTARPFGAGLAATGAKAHRVEGGFVLEGSWPFMTGAADATWCTVAARVVGAERSPDQPADVRFLVVPVDQLEVSDNWSGATGMRGTGSHAVRADGVLVPETRVVRPDQPLIVDRALYHMPIAYLSYVAPAAIAIGVLRSGVAGAVELCGTKRSRIDRHAHYEDGRVQQAITDTLAGADCLFAGVDAVAREVWDCFAAGAAPDDRLRARWWSTVFFTSDLACQLVSRLYTVSTSSTYSSANRVERALRDVHAISASIESFQSLRRAAGRVLLGHPPEHPLY